MGINLHHWMYKYQTIIHDSIMTRKLPIRMSHPRVSPRKRHLGGDDGNDRESKRRADKDPDISSGQSGSSESKDMNTSIRGGDNASSTVNIIMFTG